MIITSNLAASRSCGKMSYRLVNRGLRCCSWWRCPMSTHHKKSWAPHRHPTPNYKGPLKWKVVLCHDVVMISRINKETILITNKKTNHNKTACIIFCGMYWTLPLFVFIAGPLCGESTGRFPTQRASNAFISWRHHFLHEKLPCINKLYLYLTLADYMWKSPVTKPRGVLAGLRTPMPWHGRNIQNCPSTIGGTFHRSWIFPINFWIRPGARYE